MVKPAYPHDGSEILGEVEGAAKPLAKGNPHRCTRGNCGQALGSHEEQDAHNASVHGHFEQTGDDSWTGPSTGRKIGKTSGKFEQVADDMWA